MFSRRIIDRYISAEVLRPFFMVVIGVIVIMLSVRLSTDMQLIIVNKVPIPIVMRMMLYKMPEFIVLGLPVAYMIATLLGLARMSKDFEIVAIRATGTGSKRIMRSILLISVLVSLVSFYINEEVVPEANKRSQAATEEASIQSGEEDVLNFKDVKFKGVDSRFYSIQVVRKDQKVLERIQIFDSNEEHPYRLISAQNGSWDGSRWTLYNGVVQEYSAGASSFVDRESPFDELEVETDIQLENYLAGELKPKEMGSAELKELILATEKGGQPTLEYEIEYQSKFSRPFATFFAAMIAAPIGLKFARGGYIGFAISIILTFFYFVMQTIGEGLGTWELLPIIVAAWLPNILFGVLGLIFYVQVE